MLTWLTSLVAQEKASEPTASHERKQLLGEEGIDG